MKKVLLLSIIILLSFSLIACNANGNTSNQNESSDNSTSELSSTTFQPTAQIETTVEPTTEEITTEAPTENVQDLANQSYLVYLQNHSNWFSDENHDYYSSSHGKMIAFYDITGDGIDELIHLKPMIEERRLEMNLCILTYTDSIQTLYDDYLVSIAGAEAGYSTFVGNDSKLYCVMAKELNGLVIRFDANGNTLSPVYLAESKANHLAEPKDAICHVDGELVSFEEFYNYRNTVEEKVDTYLLINYQNSRGKKDNSLTYEEACQYLSQSQ